MSRGDEPSTDLRRLRRRLIITLIVYFFAGNASQKMVPGVDEIFPLFGWSLFSQVPNLANRYSILIHEHNGRELDPPVAFLLAPDSMVTGNRYIADKVVKALGRAIEKSDKVEVERQRRLLEQNYLLGRVRYELVFESFDPLEKWRTGESRERRSLAELRKPKRPRRRDE